MLLPVPILWSLALHVGLLTFLENRAMDWRFRIRGEIDAPVKLVYVDIDAATNRWLGERPWPRYIYGQIAEILLRQGQAKAIGFDLVMSEFAASRLVSKERLDQDVEIFAQTTNLNPNMILATAYTEGQEVPSYYKDTFHIKENDTPETPHPRFTSFHGVDQMGLINVDFDITRGTIPRWVPMFTQTYSEPFDRTFSYYQIALQLARVSFDLPPESIRHTDERIRIVDDDDNVLIDVPLFEKQMLEVNYFSKFYSPKNPRFSMTAVGANFNLLDDPDSSEEDRQEAEAFFAQFEDAIILIGPTDPLLQDIAPTPMDHQPVPKVGVHGNVLKTIFSGLYIQRYPQWVGVSLIFLLSMLVGLLVTVTGRHGFTTKLLGVLCVFGYAYFSFWCFTNYHAVIPLIAPVGSAVTASLLGAITQLLIEERQKGRIKGMFGTYLSPELVNTMIDSGEEPQLGGITETISAYFSDVQSFSAFSEILTPEQLVDLMNEYLTAMTDILMEEGCYVDKYIGDAIVGIFNAPVALPEHALRACVATQLTQVRQVELRDKWRSEGDKWPAIVSQMQTRMGVNTGTATVGNMGSAKRFNYTMMGDTVNLAARCESGAKAYGVYTMVTGETKAAAEELGDDCVFRYLDKVIVKGRSQPAEMYEIMGLRNAMADEAWECLNVYDEGIERYLMQNWDEALRLFRRSVELEPNRPEKNPYSPTTPSEVLIERALEMKANPPGVEWDGVYVMTTK